MHESVPVYVEATFPDVVRGIFKIEGTLRYSDQRLVFTYRTNATPSRDSNEVVFDLAALREVELKTRRLTWSLVLRPRRLEVLEGLPGRSRDELVFKIARTHRSEASALVNHVLRVLAETNEEFDFPINSIPFQLPDVGLREISGEIYLEDGYLVLDVVDALVGELDKDLQLIKIEPSAVKQIHLEPGLIADRLRIRPKKEDLLRLIPGTHQQELRLKIRKRDREEAEFLIHEVRRLAGASRRSSQEGES